MSLPSFPSHLLHHCIHIYLNNQRDMMYPCPTPLSILKHFLSPLFILTEAEQSTYIKLIPLKSLPFTSNILNTCHKAYLLTISYTSKSITLMCIFTLHFFSCFPIYLLQYEDLIYTGHSYSKNHKQKCKKKNKPQKQK